MVLGMVRSLVVFLLLAGSVGAADFLEDFEAYRNLVRAKLNIDVSATAPLTDTIINDFVREAVITTMPLMRGDKIKVIDTTILRQNVYTLDSTILYIRSVLWNKYDSVKALLYKPQELWYNEVKDGTDPNTTVGKTNGYDKRPSFYDYDDDNLYVFPTPSIAGDTLEIYAYRKVPSISAIDSLAVIPQAYRIPVVLYATYLSAFAIGNPNTLAFLAQYEKALTNLNATMNSRRVLDETSN